jgi:chitodextrinase
MPSERTIRRPALLCVAALAALAAMPVADAAGAARPNQGATALKVVTKNRTSITLSWRVAPVAKRWLAARKVTAKPTFIVLRNGVPKARTKSTRYRYTGLTCAKQYKLEVAMLGPSGKAVTRTGVKAKTTACTGTGTGGTAADRAAPSAPKDLAASAVTPSSVTVSWTAATDDVGVTGYAVSRDATPVGTVTAPSAVVDGLACGTAYTVGVAAVDAAGNNSALATLGVVTSACPPVDLPASVFLSPSGNDANPCSAAAPCRTFDRGFRVAQPGQHVELAAGSYGGQSLRADPAKTSADDVVIRPAAGASVTTGSLTVNGAHVTLRGFTVNGDWTTNDATDDVTFQNLVVNGGIYINSSSNVSVIGGSVGGTMDTHPQFASWPTGTHIENILVDGVTFHDIRRSNDAVHGECLQIAGGVGVTVRNSTFSNCMVFDLSITEYNGSGPPTDYLIENNVFGPSVDGGYYGLHFNTNTTDFRNFVVRNNSSTQPFSFAGLRKLTNVVVTGNVAPNSSNACIGAITYRRNVWNGAKCGATDINAPLGFVNPGALNYHLAPGAAALNASVAADAPSTDHDGVARPKGGAPDAGAFEDG